MNSLKQELVNGKGYAILPIDDLSYFQKLKTQFIEKIKPYAKETDFNSIRKVMTKMSKSDLNKVMVSLLSFDRASEIMINSCRNIVKSLSGMRFFYKEEANTYINLPGESQRRQWPHYAMSGVSPYTFIL